MNPATKAVLYIVLLPFALFGLNFVLVGVKMYSLAHTDHQRLLQACRELIAKRSTYKNVSDSQGSHPEVIVLDQTVVPFSKDIPEIVRRMNPEGIFIREDSVMLHFPEPPYSRISIIGFRDGAKQFGTFKYIDGLWFWNGDDNTKTNGEPVAIAQEMIAFASSGPMLNAIQKAGLTLAFTGCVCWLLSYLFFAIRAFKVSWLWGLSMLLGGVFLIPLFGCCRYEEAKLPYSCLFLSLASIIGGVVTFAIARS